MKFTLTTFLLVGFIGIAVFGFLAINHGGSHGHSGCLAAVAKGTDCPYETGTAASVAFHLDTFKGFSTAVFGENAGSAVTLLLLLLLSVGLGIGQRIYSRTLPLPFFLVHRLFAQPFQLQFAQWLALHENSPSVT